MEEKNTINILIKSIEKARKDCYSGYDPYDGLNSNLAKLDNRLFNILVTQTVKRSPINIRKFIGIKEERNPKAISLFILTLDNMYKNFKDEKYNNEKEKLAKWLIKDGKITDDYAYWGYNFPWQSRRSYLPKYGPCSVVTYFIGEAIKKTPLKNKKLLLNKIAKFYLLRLNNLLENNQHLCLSYTPFEKYKIVNSNAFIGYQLNYIGYILSNKKYKHKGEKIINWVISKQQKNGGWYYSPESHLGMDNFHNGYVIWALANYHELNPDNKKVLNSIEKAMRFYSTLFDEDGTPRFSLEKKYPIDIHNCSQGIITFKKLKDIGFYEGNLHEKILDWTIENMWDEDKNYFYYQKHRLWKNKIPYIRWSQAWMCYAMSKLIVK